MAIIKRFLTTISKGLRLLSPTTRRKKSKRPKRKIPKKRLSRQRKYRRSKKAASFVKSSPRKKKSKASGSRRQKVKRALGGLFKPKLKKIINLPAIGKVTHYFSRIGVCVIKITRGNISIGERLEIKGHTTSFMVRRASSFDFAQDSACASERSERVEGLRLLTIGSKRRTTLSESRRKRDESKGQGGREEYHGLARGNPIQQVRSLQIENNDVKIAHKGQLVGLKVDKRTRAGDHVFKLI